MVNSQLPRILGLVFLIEAGLGAVLLLLTGNWTSFIVIVMILAVVGTLGFALVRGGLINPEKDGINMAWKIDSNAVKVPGIRVNLGGNYQLTEPVNMVFERDSNLTAIETEVEVGNVIVTGQAGLEKITVSGIKIVRAADEPTARRELAELKVTGQVENGVLKIFAGTHEPFRFTIGRTTRVDLQITVPNTLPGRFTNQTGDITIRAMEADTVVRSNLGSLIVDNFGGGKNLTLNTQGGSITVQQIAAGRVEAGTNLGRIELTGIGAEVVSLESSAGAIRSRGVNCGTYRAKTNAGSVELYDTRSDGPVELRTNLGRIYTAGITAPGFQMLTDAGSVFYMGNVPTMNSEARSNMGAVQLRFPVDGSFNLEASSSIGAVSVGLQPSAVTIGNRNHFVGMIGGGGPLIRASSSLGAVQVSR